MSEKRFVLCKKGDVEYIEENCCVQLYSFDVLCEKLNEQQATINKLKEENSNLNSILNEVGLQKPFIKILDDYMVEYDGSCFSMHKPSDIRSFVYLMNRNNNFDELQCSYNDESMVIDDE